MVTSLMEQHLSTFSPLPSDAALRDTTLQARATSQTKYSQGASPKVLRVVLPKSIRGERKESPTSWFQGTEWMWGGNYTT